MQKNIIYLLVLPFLLMISCTNLDDIYERLDDHDARLNALENLVTNANKSIADLQRLLEIEAGKTTVVDYVPLEDGSGYVITLSNGETITLKNGSDAQAPKMGVKEKDGVLYWTINGEFIRDLDGNLIKAQAQDGLDGIAPQLRVDLNGYWEISLDGGKTWQQVKDTEGNPVKAEGNDASIDLNIIDNNDGTITITYNGLTFTVPVTEQGEEPQPTRPKMALEYVAEYNVGKTPGIFTDSHDNDMSGYYNWADAQNTLPEGYHMPTLYEMTAILCYDEFFQFEVPGTFENVIEALTIGEVSKTFKQSIKCTGNRIIYTLKCQPTDQIAEEGFEPATDRSMMAAYRYEMIGDFTDGKKSKTSHLKITARYIGDDPTVTLDTISDESYWTSNNEQDISRIFPAAGYITQYDKWRDLGFCGSY